MTPKLAVDIVANDKTDGGRRSAEKGFAGFAKKTDGQAKQSGFARVGKQLEGLKGTSKLTAAFDGLGRSVTSIATASAKIQSGLAGAARKVVGLGQEGEAALGGLAVAGAEAVGVIGGLATAAIGAGVAIYALGSKWAATGAQIDRTAKSFNMRVEDLQAARAAGERFGVSADQTDAGIGGLGSTLTSARFGGNNMALAAMSQLGLKQNLDKDGNLDLKQFRYDLADAIARQKNPFIQAKIAELFGESGELQALKQGSGALRANESDFNSTGAGLTAQEAAKSTEVFQKTVATRQRAGAAEKTLGMGAVNAAGVEADVATAAMKGAKGFAASAPGVIADAMTSAGGIVVHGAEDMVHSGFDVARSGARAVGDAFARFADRIEHQESRGRQFDRRGAPLTSSAGAIGAMQMLPSTAQETARAHGVAWDPSRFRNDKGYNENLGRLHLADLHGQFGGDEALAAAAYNAGAGKVRKWVRQFGDPRKGEISDEDFVAHIPGAFVDGKGKRHAQFQETKDYVDRTVIQPHKVELQVTFRNAPPGMVAATQGASKDVSVNATVQRGMDGG